jgi:hypothetical protein
MDFVFIIAKGQGLVKGYLKTKKRLSALTFFIRRDRMEIRITSSGTTVFFQKKDQGERHVDHCQESHRIENHQADHHPHQEHDVRS